MSRTTAIGFHIRLTVNNRVVAVEMTTGARVETFTADRPVNGLVLHVYVPLVDWQRITALAAWADNGMSGTGPLARRVASNLSVVWEWHADQPEMNVQLFYRRKLLSRSLNIVN